MSTMSTIKTFCAMALLSLSFSSQDRAGGAYIFPSDEEVYMIICTNDTITGHLPVVHCDSMKCDLNGRRGKHNTSLEYPVRKCMSKQCFGANTEK